MNYYFKLQFIAVLIFLSISGLHAQDNFSVIKLNFIDSVSNRQIPFVTVSLLDSEHKAIKVLIADAKGALDIPNNNKFIQLAFTATGYQQKIYSLSQLLGTSPIIKLSPSVYNLKEVTVLQTKPLIKREVDRLTYNVQQDPEKSVLSISDVLSKMPLIATDGNNLTLNGSTSYRIFIDGKPSAMFNGNPSIALKGIAAESIARVELITTPPAKYDGEGLVGIINIVTMKAGLQGYSAKFGAKYTSPDGPSINHSFSIKSGGFGLSNFGGWTELKSPHTNSTLLRNTSVNQLTQNGVNKSRNRFPYEHLEASYEIDTLNLITASFDYSGSSGYNNIDQQSAISNGTTALDQQYNLLSKNDNKTNTYDLGLNFEKTFNQARNELLTFSYKRLINKSNSNTQSIISPVVPMTAENSFAQINKYDADENTFQVDFTNTGKTLSVEAGAKEILRSNRSNFSYSNDEKGDFDYNQNVFSLYNSYGFKIKKTEFKAGVRLEHTHIRFLNDDNFKNNYINLLPSISILQTVDDANSFSLGYSIRIERPGILELNPFIDRSDPQSISVGNPFIRPSVNNNIELNHSYSGKLSVNSGITFNNTSRGIDVILTSDANSGVITSSYGNVATNNRIGVNSSVSGSIANGLSATFNASAAYNRITGVIGDVSYKSSATLATLFASATQKFGKTVSVTLNSSYNNGILLLQGRTNHAIFYSGSVTKTFLSKKLIGTLGINNPFSKYRDYIYKTNTNTAYQVFTNQNYYRKFSIGLSYKFGVLRSQIKSNQRSIENNDLKGSL